MCTVCPDAVYITTIESICYSLTLQHNQPSFHQSLTVLYRANILYQMVRQRASLLPTAHSMFLTSALTTLREPYIPPSQSNECRCACVAGESESGSEKSDQARLREREQRRISQGGGGGKVGGRRWGGDI